MTFTPYNEAHSITEMIVYIQYKSNFSANTVQNLTLLQDDLKEELPVYTEIHKKEFEIKLNASEQTNEATQKDALTGVELKKLNQDRKLEWVLKTTENTIEIHCLDYSRWKSVLDTILGIYSKVLVRLDTDYLEISRIGFMAVDKYKSEIEKSKITLTDLIDNNTNWIFPNAFNSTNGLWHSNVGMFKKTKEHEFLNQLDANAELLNSTDNLVININHNAICEVDIKNRGGLESIISMLHKNNKEVLKDILSTEMAERINL